MAVRQSFSFTVKKGQLKKMQYNESQSMAIDHFMGPALVLAGPGSGKTAVVTKRVCTLIEKYNVNPSNILVITFTKAAADEMKERFCRMMDGCRAVSFGTFHGVFFTILKHAYNYSAGNIIGEEEQFSLLKRIVTNFHLEYENEKDFLAGLLTEISRVKGDRLDIDSYYPVNCAKEVFTQIYESYDRSLRHNNKLDFDDMILRCYELFRERGDILSAWQNKYRYILIDEFQDINLMQYEVVKMLAAPDNNIFIVGDDDQSIYGFRGARPDIMQLFTKDYPDTKIISLDVNYRCQEKVVEHALKLINHNENRFKKNIRASRKSDEPVHITEYQDVFEETSDIISLIKKYHEQGISYSEMAVLTRTNEGGRYLIGKLMEHNIPFSSKDSIPSIYSHWIAKNVMAYINMALGNRDRNVFLQIMNKPKRYISRDVLTSPIVNFDEIRAEYINDRAWMMERIDRLEEDLHMLSGLNPYGAINYIRRGIGYDEYLTEYALEMQIPSDELFDVLNELMEASREFDSYSEWFKYIEQYEIMLKNKTKNNREEEKDAVAIVTMHCAKGLEYKVVFIPDTNEGIIPYKKALLNNEIEEERRMMYVAMTRAKDHLYISHVKTRFNKTMEKSRFINELE